MGWRQSVYCWSQLLLLQEKSMHISLQLQVPWHQAGSWKYLHNKNLQMLSARFSLSHQRAGLNIYQGTTGSKWRATTIHKPNSVTHVTCLIKNKIMAHPQSQTHWIYHDWPLHLFLNTIATNPFSHTEQFAISKMGYFFSLFLCKYYFLFLGLCILSTRLIPVCPLRFDLGILSSIDLSL